MDRDHERMREAEAKVRQSQVLNDPHPVSDCNSGCETAAAGSGGAENYASSLSEPTYRLRRRVERLHAQSQASQEMAYQLSALLDCLPNRLPTGAAAALNYLLSTAGF